jgi:hypothetical protein
MRGRINFLQVRITDCSMIAGSSVFSYCDSIVGNKAYFIGQPVSVVDVAHVVSNLAGYSIISAIVLPRL